MSKLLGYTSQAMAASMKFATPDARMAAANLEVYATPTPNMTVPVYIGDPELEVAESIRVHALKLRGKLTSDYLRAVGGSGGSVRVSDVAAFAPLEWELTAYALGERGTVSKAR